MACSPPRRRSPRPRWSPQRSTPWSAWARRATAPRPGRERRPRERRWHGVGRASRAIASHRGQVPRCRRRSLLARRASHRTARPADRQGEPRGRRPAHRRVAVCMRSSPLSPSTARSSPCGDSPKQLRTSKSSRRRVRSTTPRARSSRRPWHDSCNLLVSGGTGCRQDNPAQLAVEERSHPASGSSRSRMRLSCG